MFANVFAPKRPMPKALRDKVMSDVTERIRLANPLRALVFGSFADGTAHLDSDIDILVVCRDTQDVKSARNAIYQNLKGPITLIPVDFIFVTRDDFEKRKDIGGVCMIANEQGMLVFEAT